jgi:D-alanyl-D-alanine carboxypeptidase
MQRFPITGGILYTTNTNPLLLSDYPGTIGLKTGYTQEAGRCFIAVVRRGGRTLATVLLHSPDPSGQARRLFAQAFKTPG